MFFSNCCLFANDKKKNTKNIDIFEFVQSVYKKFINLLLPLYHMDINTSPLSWISTGGWIFCFVFLFFLGGGGGVFKLKQ